MMKTLILFTTFWGMDTRCVIWTVSSLWGNFTEHFLFWTWPGSRLKSRVCPSSCWALFLQTFFGVESLDTVGRCTTSYLHWTQELGHQDPPQLHHFFFKSLPPISPTSSYDFVIFATPIQGGVLEVDNSKLCQIFPNLPPGLPDIMEDSFQWRIHSRGRLRFLNPFPTSSFVMFFSSKVYYFSLQRTPRFFLSVWKRSLVSLKTLPQMSNADLPKFEQNAHPNMHEPCL
jgi:hypothetical protein